MDEITRDATRLRLAPIIARNATEHPDWKFDAHIAALQAEGFTFEQAHLGARAIAEAILRNERNAAAAIQPADWADFLRMEEQEWQE